MLKICMILIFLFTFGLSEQKPVYVTLFMHNEDGALGDFNNPETRENYKVQRESLIKFGNMLKKNQVSFSWQSDWKFLEGVLKYDDEELKSVTNGKNIVCYLKEDLGVYVDPHSHQNYGYNYADVAYLIDSLGVEPSDIVGGHIWDPYSEKYANWEVYRDSMSGTHYPQALWKGNVLIGSGTPGHVQDPHPCGIWRPKDKYHFWEDDPLGKIVCVGQYTGDLEGVYDLIEKNEEGFFSEDEIITINIMTPQKYYPDFTENYEDSIVKPLIELRDSGKIEIVSFTELIEIWKTEYEEKSHLYNAPSMSLPDSFTVRIPSLSGGAEGIFCKIFLPENPRYGSQAPIVIHIPGGWDGMGLSNGYGLHEKGFIEILFNFPGNGLPGEESGGIYDDRGEKCVMAAGDVAAFALGIKKDSYGYSFQEMIGSLEPLTDNTGFAGWSNGGNLTVTTAGALGDKLPGLGWIVNWESPVGDGMPTTDAGNSRSPNRAYDDLNGVFRWELLQYSESIKQEGDVFGGLYFDVDSNGVTSEGDFIISPYYYRDSLFYSLQVIEQSQQKGFYLPASFAGQKSCEEFWKWRNGEIWIEDALLWNPRLMFIVEAGDRDHVQSALNHPHILIQYNGFRKSGCIMARLNPDNAYVEYAVGAPVPEAPDNDALMEFDNLTVRDALEPRTSKKVTMISGMTAAICEAADRCQWDNTDKQVNEVITSIKEMNNNHSLPRISNYPNPFKKETIFWLKTGETGLYQLTVYNILGQEIIGWDIAVESSRDAQFFWNGKNQHGIAVSSGVYLYDLKKKNNIIAKGKLTIIR